GLRRSYRESFAAAPCRSGASREPLRKPAKPPRRVASHAGVLLLAPCTSLHAVLVVTGLAGLAGFAEGFLHRGLVAGGGDLGEVGGSVVEVGGELADV